MDRMRKIRNINLVYGIIFFMFSVILMNQYFFTKDKIIEKTVMVGINPMTSTKSSMCYQEPLTIILKEEKNEVNLQEDTILPVETEERIEAVPTEFKGFETIGKIEIPKTGVDIPILNQVTVKGMENAPCLLYSTGDLNQEGNNLIVGHNYRNGTIFSDNKKLTLGDKIYITTLEGERVEYTIYDKFITTAEEVSYIKRDTKGKPEITLSCCTDDDTLRIIVLGKVES
jgi:LPXTG-site transpeptidase (sortase) family protein